jgi:hypothetical protein
MRVGSLAVLAALVCTFAATAEAGAPTHESFVQQADIVCWQAATEAKGLPKPKTTVQAVSVLKDSISIGAMLRSQTLAIPAPAADKPLIKRGMAQIAVELAALKRARAALMAGKTAAYQADMKQAQAAHAKAVAAARKLGLKSCS